MEEVGSLSLEEVLGVLEGTLLEMEVAAGELGCQVGVVVACVVGDLALAVEEAEQVLHFALLGQP
jgi:hypothetical protein